MVKNVFRIQTNRSSQILPNSELLGECHVDAPGSRVLQSVQAEIAPRSRRWILKDDLPALGIRHDLQRAQVLQVCRDRSALRIPDAVERCWVEVAAVELAGCAREETPRDFASCSEV